MRHPSTEAASTRRSTCELATAGPDSTDGPGSLSDDPTLELALRVVREMAAQPDSQRELMGEVFLVCAGLREGQPEAFREAERRGELVGWCVPQVRRALRAVESGAESSTSRPRGGWLGTFVGPDARACAPDDAFAGRDVESLQLAERALARAISIARERGQSTLLRNLGWYRQRLEHRTYDAIARAEGRVPATVRTGVARARKFVLRVVHELEHEQPAPLCADAPSEIEPLRQLWLDQELDALQRELERTRESFGRDPTWLNLSGLLEASRGHRSEARRLYEQGLVEADAASVRARLLNNLANLADDEGDREQARIFWLRAHQLSPQCATPLLNLLAAASARQDYPAAQHFVALLGELLSSGRLSTTERAYLCRRLRENPRLDWLRDTETWRLGPARWLRAESDRPRPRAGVARSVAALGALVLALVVGPTVGASEIPDATASVLSVDVEMERLAEHVLPQENASRGGDSMGGPADRGGRKGE